MDLWLYLWVALMGIIPPAITSAITSAIVGYLLYLYGKKQGEKSKVIVTNEIKTYIKGEFLQDLTVAVRDQLNGILGPIGKAGSAEAQAAAAEYAKSNPGIAQLLLSVAARGGARVIGKKLGVPKDVIDQITLVGQPPPSNPKMLLKQPQTQIPDGIPIVR